MVCYGCHPDYCICPQPDDQVSSMGRRSPRPYAQNPTHRQQRSNFDSDPSLRPARGFFDNGPVNYAPASFHRHHQETLGHNPDLFATNFHNSIDPNQQSAAHGQRGRDPYLTYNFSSSSGTFHNTHGIPHAGTAADYSGSFNQDDQRSRQPIQSSSPQRARSSSSDSFVYDVGFKSVQDARRRAARRERGHETRETFDLQFTTRYGEVPINSQSKGEAHHSSFRRTMPTTKWRKQVCYGCTPGYCICPTVSDDSD